MHGQALVNEVGAGWNPLAELVKIMEAGLLAFGFNSKNVGDGMSNDLNSARDDFRSNRAYFAAEPIDGEDEVREPTEPFRKSRRKRYLMTLALIAGTTVLLLLE